MAQQQDTVVPPTSPNPDIPGTAKPGPGDHDAGPTPNPFPNGGALSDVGYNYIIYGTNQPYSGRVVEVGGQLYTTVGGAYEGFSFQVYPAGGQRDKIPQPPKPRPRPRRIPDAGTAPRLRPSPFDPNANIGGYGDGTTGGTGGWKEESGPPVDDTIIIDDPMGRDPLAGQEGGGY